MGPRAAALINSRVSFHRLSDAKVFRGWVVGFAGGAVAVNVSSPVSASPGESYRFEIHGADYTAIFRARFGTLSDQILVCAVEGQIRYLRAFEERRVRLCGISGLAGVPPLEEEAREGDAGPSIPFELVDASANGLGLLVPRFVQPGTVLQIDFETGAGRVCCTAEVRYCRAQDTRFRIGLSILELDRLSHGAFSRMLSTDGN